MTDSIETSEREATPVDLRTEAMRKSLPVPAELLAGEQDAPAVELPTAKRLQQLANAVRLALVFLKDDQATAADRDLVVAELERCVGCQPGWGEVIQRYRWQSPEEWKDKFLCKPFGARDGADK